MRPGRSRPGKWRASTSATTSRASCFNEAGALAPRKEGWRRRSGRAVLRFNEAGALAPRKDTVHLALSETIEASMRPGRSRPGKPPIETLEIVPDDASMRPGRSRPGKPAGSSSAAISRRCFNEAGALAPRKGDPAVRGRPVHAASMRPGRSRPGKEDRAAGVAGGVRASMRPGRSRPGKRVVATD